MLRTTISGGRGAFRAPIRSNLQRSTPITPLRSLARRTITSSAPSRAPKPSTSFTFTSHARPSPPQNSTLLQRIRSLRFFHNTRPRRNGKPSPEPGPNPNVAEAEPQSLGARMRKLSREYGWSALGVYFALTALDFPFCYMFVRYMGTDRIGEWEHIVVSNLKKLIPESVQQAWHDWRASMKKAENDMTGNQEVTEHVDMVGWGVEEADARNKKEASLATQLALAYAIHKSFIFIRVPLTISITPKVVRVLRSWGWDIGKRTTKEARAIKRATIQASKPAKKR